MGFEISSWNLRSILEVSHFGTSNNKVSGHVDSYYAYIHDKRRSLPVNIFMFGGLPQL